MNGPPAKLKVTIVTACIVAAVAAPATGSAAIEIARIRYNPPGADSGSNRHLNHEFIVIRNTGQHREALTHWRIVERVHGDVFEFPSFHLAPGRKVTIHTGIGDDRAHHLFWNSSMYVWHNFSDEAVLRDGDDHRVDRCDYVVDGETKQWLGHAADC
jgi:hypothetical protein